MKHSRGAPWYEFIGDPLLADAFMDRIRSRAHLLQLKGKSLRCGPVAV
ncbi:ATP-binding protein [Yoonia sp. SDW83-1]